MRPSRAACGGDRCRFFRPPRERSSRNASSPRASRDGCRRASRSRKYRHRPARRFLPARGGESRSGGRTHERCTARRRLPRRRLRGRQPLRRDARIEFRGALRSLRIPPLRPHPRRTEQHPAADRMPTSARASSQPHAHTAGCRKPGCEQECKRTACRKRRHTQSRSAHLCGRIPAAPSSIRQRTGCRPRHEPLRSRTPTPRGVANRAANTSASARHAANEDTRKVAAHTSAAVSPPHRAASGSGQDADLGTNLFAAARPHRGVSQTGLRTRVQAHGMPQTKTHAKSQRTPHGKTHRQTANRMSNRAAHAACRKKGSVRRRTLPAHHRRTTDQASLVADSSFFMIEKMNSAERRQSTISTLQTIHSAMPLFQR